MFDDTLVGLRGLRKAIIIMVIVYYSKKVHIKIIKGKRHTGWSPGKTRTSFCSYPVKSYRKYLILSAITCDNTCAMSPTGEAHKWRRLLSLGVWGSVTYDADPTFQRLDWNCGLKASGIQKQFSPWSHYCHKLYGVVQGFRHTEILSSGRIQWSSKAISKNWAKGKSCRSWEGVGLSSPSLLS